ncbi:MAG: hypothetical protein ACTSPI_09290 [Candidatus Heimdallarchaeaceae archaeon]
MEDYSKQLMKAREDVELAVEIWKDLLSEFYPDRIEYCYAKGSALKNWQNDYDYVPILSDIDIQLSLKKSIFTEEEFSSFYEAVMLSRKYEEQFITLNPSFLHIPRIQIFILNDFTKMEGFQLPRKSDVHWLFGRKNYPDDIDEKENNERLMKELLDLKRILLELSIKCIDRVGIDWWTLIRRLNWRVSPSPVRLLMLLEPGKSEIWNWNRTKIIERLLHHGFTILAEDYITYYRTGWKLFLSNFSDYSAYRDLTIKAFEVLKECYIQTINLIEQENN